MKILHPRVAVDLERNISGGIPLLDPERDGRQDMARKQLIGEKAKVKRTDGQIDDGWLILGFNEDSSVDLLKEGVGRKTVPIEKFVELNPNLIRKIELN